MNVTTNNRLIGIAIVLIVLFLLTWLIPSKKTRTKHQAPIPIAAVPIGSRTSSNPAVRLSTIHSGASPASGNSVITTKLFAPTSLSSKAEVGTNSKRPGSAVASATKDEADLKPLSHSTVRVSTGKHYVSHRQQLFVPSPAREAKTGFYVQLAGFRKMRDAQRMTSRLHHQLIRAKIDQTVVNGHRYYRVWLGPYRTRRLAEKERERMARHGFRSAWVSRRH